MAGKIFINYRRDDSIGMAGRLHDRLAQTFGQKNLFMDVDSIPAGVDFVADLNGHVAARDVVLVVIGRNWLDAKDETGRQRLHNPDDFVVIEIATALARDIRVIPVLVDGAHMPKASELPDPIKPLVRRNAVEMRNAQFGRDAEALIEKIRKALNAGSAAPRPWRKKVVVAAALAVLLLFGVGGYTFVQNLPERGPQQAEHKWDEERTKAAAEADERDLGIEQIKTWMGRTSPAKRKADEAEQQRLTAKAEQERQAKAAAEVREHNRAIADFTKAISSCNAPTVYRSSISCADPQKTTELGKPVGADLSLKTWQGDQWKIGGAGAGVETAAAGAVPEKKMDQEASCREKGRSKGVYLLAGDPCFDIDDVIKKLATGIYRFNTPKSAYVEEPLRVVLTVATEGQDVSSAFRGIPENEIARKEEKIAQHLEATLSGLDFKVEPSGAQQRTMTSGSPVIWEWTVVPLRPGKKTMVIEVAANLVLGAQKDHVQLRTLREEIQINVGILHWFVSTFAGLWGIGLGLATMIIAILGVYHYLPTMRHKGRRRRHSDEPPPVELVVHQHPHSDSSATP